MIAVVNRRAGGGHTFSRALNRALKGGRGVSIETIAMIESFVEKYLAMLGEQDLPRPQIEFRSNIVAEWLGQDVWSLRKPTTTLRLQKSILGDPRTLERVIAHEMIHHVDFLRMSEPEIEMLVEMRKLGRKTYRDAHGESFLAKAAQINVAMGDGFVTKVSDAEYVTARNVKPFFLLIVPLSTTNDKLGWAWAARLSGDGQTRVAKQLALGARLVQSTNDLWLYGAKIKKYGGVSVPRKPEDQAELRRLFTEEPEVGIAASFRAWAQTQIEAQVDAAARVLFPARFG